MFMSNYIYTYALVRCAYYRWVQHHQKTLYYICVTPPNKHEYMCWLWCQMWCSANCKIALQTITLATICAAYICENVAQIFLLARCTAGLYERYMLWNNVAYARTMQQQFIHICGKVSASAARQNKNLYTYFFCSCCLMLQSKEAS